MVAWQHQVRQQVTLEYHCNEGGGVVKMVKFLFSQHNSVAFTVFTICIRTDRPEQTV